MTLKNRTKDLGPRVNKEKAAEAENIQYSTNPRIPWDLRTHLALQRGWSTRRGQITGHAVSSP